MKIDLGLEALKHEEQSVNIHQMATGVLVDFYEEVSTPDLMKDKVEAVCNLKQISDSLEFLDEVQQEVVLDYYSHDPAFVAIVGTENRKENLKQAIDKFEEEYSNESAAIAAMVVGGMGLYIGTQVGNKTIDGCYNLCKKINKSDLKSFDTKLANVPSYDDLIKHLDNMIKFAKALKDGITDPKKFTPATAIKLIESLGFKNIKEKDLFSWSAAFRSAIFGTIKSVGWGIVAGVGALLVSVATLGFGIIPATVVAATFHGYKTAKGYHDSYSKGLNNDAPSLINMGYNEDKLMSVCSKYMEVNDIIRQAATVKQTQPAEEQNEDSFKGTTNVFVASLKGTASVIANLIRAATK